MQDVQPAPRRDPVDGGNDSGIVARIQRHGLGLSTRRPDFPGHRLRTRAIQIGDGDHCPFARQCQRPRPPDAGPRPRQKRHAPRQQHQRPSFRAPRRRISCAAISRTSEMASTMVPMALISGVTPRRIEEKT